MMELRRFGTWPMVLCLLLGLTVVGCGGDGDGDGGGQSVTDTNSADAGADGAGVGAGPTVNTTPANGAKGVKIDAPVVISFSKPMNTASVEGAYTSDSLPKDQISVVWSANNTVATIDASALMKYGDGGINGGTFGYGFTIADTAEDADGNRLSAPVTVNWDTARDITVTITGGQGTPDKDEIGAATGTFYGNSEPLSKLAYVAAGDGDSNEIYIGFVTMALGSLPPAIVEVVSAEFKVEQNSATASVYKDLGKLMIQHVNPLTEAPKYTDYSGTARAEQVFSDDATAGAGQFRTAEVADWVKADLDAGAANISFRFAFVTGQDGDNSAETAVLQDRALKVRVLAE